MRPFFSYYGAKYTSAKHYGPPKHDLVVEPFAGSACYSTRWNVRRAKLYDVSPDICDLWDFLIRCSERDIASIPDTFEHIDEVFALPRSASLLCRFWVAKGRAEPSGALSPWYFRWRGSHDCRVWGPAVKARIIAQKPEIALWEVDQRPYWQADTDFAHWHVDPPYNSSAGRRYPYSDIDYAHLAAWCRSLPGYVEVCENVGADWLPFTESHSVVSSRGRRDGTRSQEALWRRI